jgi:hypothetical protein
MPARGAVSSVASFTPETPGFLKRRVRLQNAMRLLSDSLWGGKGLGSASLSAILYPLNNPQSRGEIASTCGSLASLKHKEQKRGSDGQTAIAL